MRYRRYGEFRVGDYLGSWFGIAVLLVLAIASVLLRVSIWYVFIPIVFSIVWLVFILVPNFECFVLHKDSITAFLGKRRRVIAIPRKVTLVISSADICPPFAIRTACGKQTHVLKNRYAVSILYEMPLEATLEVLHKNYVQEYTTSMIKAYFEEYRYIYSFVCNQELLKALMVGREGILIIPESLQGELTLNSELWKIYIDMGH